VPDSGTSVPRIARIYDYWLGGKDNFAADREAERERVTVLHYDGDYDLIAQVTGQPVQWVIPRGTVP
jgi:hypothetical protein